jgi:5-formyltetrahydrofolate cyclo-ligase
VVLFRFGLDKEGHRVGYGKGFYDVFFMQPEQLKLDSLFEAEELTDIYETDVKLDYCVSPNTI